MDDVTWGALTLTLTLLGGTWTWFAFRRRGLPSGLRALAWTLLPAAAWLTGTLEVVTEVAGSLADWATSLVFSPTVWVGVVLAGVSGLLFVVSGALLGRRAARAVPGRERKAMPPPTAGRGEPAVADDDMADIEALLRKRGIT